MNCKEAVQDSVKRRDSLSTPTGEYITEDITTSNMSTGWVTQETMDRMRECGLLNQVSPNREKLTPEGMLYLKDALKE